MKQKGPYAKGIAKREEILSTALDVIARNGYRRTSVKEIADAVGLSQPGVLHYFSSKEELFTQILRKRDDLDMGREHEAPEFLGRIKDTVEHNSKVAGLVRLYTQLSAEATDADHPAHTYFAERYELLRDSLTVEIQAGQESGELRDDIPAANLAMLTISVMDGIQVQWLYDPSISMVDQLSLVLTLASQAG
ncbi:TetR/AcrR family transcriptional regulator [Glutamicibacter sp. NPDC087344]|uniref:TetR/AcrR family transcriptional regulator n=1 Tax=Glutamicibacter sp. NPDC087344 TaxID=3363994 RepID=UPI00381EB9D0